MQSFFNHLIHPSYYIISDFFSYWGHYGIVIFLFISGYGLVIKYEKKTLPVFHNTYDFIKNHYLKLFHLMIWGFFANMIVNKLCIGYFFHDKWTIPGQLLFIINLIPNAHINPGPYWYLGMTLQLYIIYIIIISKKSDYSIYLLLVLCILLQLFCKPDGDVIFWMRRNFIGCFLAFAVGIIAARHHIILHMRYRYFTSIILIAIVFLCNYNFYLWLITPLFIIPLSIHVTKACISYKKLFLFFTKIGDLSSNIFIMHPIAHWLLLPSENKRGYLYLILYLVLSIYLGYLYRYFLNSITDGFTYIRNKHRD